MSQLVGRTEQRTSQTRWLASYHTLSDAKKHFASYTGLIGVIAVSLPVSIALRERSVSVLQTDLGEKLDFQLEPN